MEACDFCENNISTTAAIGFDDGRRGRETAGAAAAAAEEAVDESSEVQLAIVMTYLSVLSVIGTGGNGLVLYVYAKKKDTLVSTLFILVLAVVDFTTCLVIMPYTIYMEYRDFHVDIDVFCKLYLFLVTSNIPFSALIMVAIAVDRYFCICHPFLHVMTVARAKVMIVALAVFATGLGICVALIYGVRPVYESNDSSIATLLLNISSSSSNGSDSSTASMSATMLLTMPPLDTMAFQSDGGGNEERSVSEPSVVRSSDQCKENDLIISLDFQWYYQKLYTALFPTCLAIVVVLYALIYCKVINRRSRRQKQKSRSLGLVQSLTSAVRRKGDLSETNATDDTLVLPGPLNELNSFVTTTDPCAVVGTAGLSPAAAVGKRRNTGAEGGVVDGRISLLQTNGRARRSSKADTMFLANMKTAAMLFVVTVVFIVTYLPAFLMVLKLMPYNIIIFYMYFANNCANPVIYSFMNQNFRVDLRKIFCHKH